MNESKVAVFDNFSNPQDKLKNMIKLNRLEEKRLKFDISKGFSVLVKFFFSEVGDWDLRSFNDRGGNYFLRSTISCIEGGKKCIIFVESELFEEPFKILFDGQGQNRKSKIFKNIINQITTKINENNEKKDIFMYLLCK